MIIDERPLLSFCRGEWDVDQDASLQPYGKRVCTIYQHQPDIFIVCM